MELYKIPYRDSIIVINSISTITTSEVGYGYKNLLINGVEVSRGKNEEVDKLIVKIANQLHTLTSKGAE